MLGLTCFKMRIALQNITFFCHNEVKWSGTNWKKAFNGSQLKIACYQVTDLVCLFSYNQNWEYIIIVYYIITKMG